MFVLDCTIGDEMIKSEAQIYDARDVSKSTFSIAFVDL